MLFGFLVGCLDFDFRIVIWFRLLWCFILDSGCVVWFVGCASLVCGWWLIAVFGVGFGLGVARLLLLAVI